MDEHMAQIEPFQGIRYDLGRVGELSDVVAPPYDVIDPPLQKRLYDRHPNNIIRLELSPSEPGDGENTKYQRAGRMWKDWLREGILCHDSQPQLYVLHQHYAVDGHNYVRKGVFARVRLERFGEGRIFPHEQTLSGPKEDRFRLLQATHANLSPVFGLYPDPERSVQQLLDRIVERQLPVEAVDHLGVGSRVWPVHQPHVMREVAELLHEQPIFIADGHHRYETALRYRDELEKKQGPLPPHHAAHGILMALVGMSDPGLLILPTHRLVKGLSGLNSEQLMSRLKGAFEFERLSFAEVRDRWERVELEGSQDELLLGTAADRTWILAKFKAQELLETLAPDQSEAWRELAVSRLHVVVINHGLGSLGVPTFQFVHTLTEALEAWEKQTCDLACLVPPAQMHHVTAIAGRLEKMPPKTTYFYPKLLTGLVFHSLVAHSNR